MTDKDLMSAELAAYRDAESFEDVHLAHWTGSVVLKPRIHAALMKHMSEKQHIIILVFSNRTEFLQ